MAPNSCREKLKHWAERTTFHGIAQIATSKNNLVKVVWMVCFVVSTYACGKTVVTNLVDYYQYDVDTVVEMTRVDSSDFPTVTICQLHFCGIEAQEYTNFLQSDNLPDFFDYTNYQQTGDDVQLIFDNFRRDFLSNYSKDELKQLFNNDKLSLKNNLISCQYGNEPCSSDDFESVELTEFQKCFRFNSGRDFYGNRTSIRDVRRYGRENGLKLELFIGQPEDCKSPLSSKFGLILYVHNNTYSVWEENNGVELLPGYETDVAIDRTVLSKMPDPYSECIINNDPSLYTSQKAVQDTFEIAGTYTQQSCLQICYQKFLLLTYKCYDGLLPFYNGTSEKPCGRIIDSFSNMVYSDKILFYKEQNQKCLDQCPLECESVSYKATLSSTEFPSLTYAEVVRLKVNLTDPDVTDSDVDTENAGYSTLRESVISVNVFYKSDMITMINERPQTAPGDLISNLGGTLGLFLGISFLSFVELLEIISEMIIIKIEKALARNRNVVHVRQLKMND